MEKKLGNQVFLLRYKNTD